MITYKDSGVNIDAGNLSVELMKNNIRRTFRKEVLADIGGFSGLFEVPKKYKNPVLVSGTDGVGTKLKIAFMMDKHDTIGIDCVAMCVNDILCQSAEPLFFLDYIATGKIYPEKIAEIVKGVAEGCLQAGCSLIGGETAEMPGFYPEGEYDIAGFAVGIVDRNNIIDGSSIKKGDVVLGIPSSGVHSNGYSLVRKLFFDVYKYNVNSYIQELGMTLGEELLKPTRIYVKPVLKILEKFKIKGIAHITGGGFIENIPRIIPKGLRTVIQKNSFEILPIFNIIKSLGSLTDEEMFRTFNMGIGLVLVVEESIADDIVRFAGDLGEKMFKIGSIIEGEPGVEFING